MHNLCTMYSPSGQQNPHTVLIFITVYLPILAKQQFQTMINYTLTFNAGLKNVFATSFQAKPCRPSQFFKHQIYGAEFLTKRANPNPWSPLPHCHLLSCDSRSLNQRQQSIKETWLRIAQPFSILPEATNHLNKSYHNKRINHTIQKLVTARKVDI